MVLFGLLVLVTLAGCSPNRHQVVLGMEPPAPPEETAVARHSVTATSAGADHTYGIAGWYLVSAPMGVGASAYGVSAVWRWNSGSSRYEKFEYLEPGRGYWVRLNPAHRVQVSGSQEIWEPLSAGWNMISISRGVSSRAGLRFESAGVVKNYAEAVAAGWIRPTIWGYQASEGNQYHGAEALSPWYGYFLFANRNLIFLGSGGAAGVPDPVPGPTPDPVPVRTISRLEAMRLAAVGIDVGIQNISILEMYDIYSRETVNRWVEEYRAANPPPAWPDPASAYEESFSSWVRQRCHRAAVGSAVLWPPQAAIGHGYTAHQRPWVYVIILSGQQGLERWLIDIRRGLAFRWDEVLKGAWVKM